MQFPQRFGKYSLLKRIATGGMADIFLAQMRSNQGFEKEVVIKRLREEHANNPDLVGMFLDEARTAANLTHPNIAQIFDLGEEQDGYFIAMEFVRGVDLRRVCEQGIAENNYLPLHHSVRILADVCDALAYAHAEVSTKGTRLEVVHRDVSPTNILLSYDGAVKLIDFGIAKARTQATLTKVGQIKGKFGYMAPEQCRGETVDARTDIFAVGINLYEVTVGRRLFRGDSEVETLEKIESCDIESPCSINPNYPEQLERIVLRALQKDPDDRYQDARQMQMALEEYLVSAGLRSTAGMLAGYMRRIFRDQIAVETEELAELRSLAPSEPAPEVPAAAVEAPVAASTLPEDDDPTLANPISALDRAAAEVLSAEDAQPAETPPPETPPADPGPNDEEPTVQVAQRAPASVVVDPALTAPGLRSEAATPPPAAGIRAQAGMMNPWSTLTPVAPPAPRYSRGLRVAHAPAQPPSEFVVDEDLDIAIKGPSRNYIAPLVVLLLVVGGGYGLYRVMAQDAASDRARGNQNMSVAPPRLQDLAQDGEGESAPKPPPAKAMLELKSTPPGARVIVNGNVVAGLTPTAVQTFANQSVTVQMVLGGHTPAEKRLAIRSSAAVHLELARAKTLPVGKFQLGSTPDQAEVLLNGEAVGLTPLDLEDVPANAMHALQLRRKGFHDHTVLADVEPNGEARLHIRLAPVVGERTMAQVAVESYPIGAMISRVEPEKTKKLGRTSGKDALKINARIGHPLHLRAESRTYAPALADLDIKDAYYSVYLRLKPPVLEYGAITITGKRGLTVYVGPSEIGKIPVKRHRVEVGEHTVVVFDEKANVRAEVKLAVEKGQTVARTAKFDGERITIQ